MKLFLIPVFMTAFTVGFGTYASPTNQISFDSIPDFNTFIKQATAQYDSTMNSATKNYADMLEKSWEEFEALAPVPMPIWREKPQPIRWRDGDDIPPIQDREWKMTVVVTPKPKPAPTPQPLPDPQPVPIPKPNPVPAPHPKPKPQPVDRKLSFALYGNNISLPKCPKISINSLNSNDIANAWRQMECDAFGNLVSECVRLKKELNLCDWAYMNMVHKMAISQYPNHKTAAKMLEGYVLLNSGIRTRYIVSQGNLDVLFACPAVIYGRSFCMINGTRYYSLENKNIGSYYTYDTKTNIGREVDIEIKVPKFEATECKLRTMTNHAGDFKADVSVCNALMSFYEEYPSAAYSNSFVTRWAICARAPFSEPVKRTLYPALRDSIKDKTPYEAIDLILSICQKSLPYGYDNEIWGCDRAFYPEETLYYPKCDCEDHAIFFARLIYDILGYNVAVVHVPGHLLAAVCAPGLTGDYITIDGKRFYVCEPTCSGHIAPGRCMSSLDNAQAVAIFE